MPNFPVIYDSNDPGLPNLPNSLLHTNESDEFSEEEEEEELHDNDNHDNINNNESSDSLHFGNSTQSTQHPEGIPSATIRTRNRNNKGKHRRKRNNRNRRYSNTYSSSQARERISWEPGIDINDTNVILASMGSSVTITDYNQDRYRVERIDVETKMRADQEDTSEFDSDVDDSNEDKFKKSSSFKEQLEEKSIRDCAKLEGLLSNRPNWSKVRWINVNGISWETIVVLSNHFKLHKLSIEDLIDIPTRTKIDLYPDCLFGVIALTKLVKETKDERIDDEYPDWLTSLFKSGKNNKTNDNSNRNQINPHQYESMSVDERLSKFYKMRHLNDSFKPTLNSKGEHSKRRRRNSKFLNMQKPLSYRNLFIGVEQCSFFLLKNGTVITFFESSGDDIENAILSRISKNETILKKSCDPSILFQNIIDVIVDIIYPILTAYRKRLDEFEVEALMNPNLDHTRSLHLLYGELESLRGQILPITALINSIRDLSQQQKQQIVTPSQRRNNPSINVFNDDSLKLISPFSEIYFADIIDHTLMFTSEIEAMINTTQNLIDLIFNTISADTNNSMKQLSWITVIFLPMSFWTGYYGMNFEIFGDLQNSVSLYWKIAIPFSFGLVCLLTWGVVKVYYKRIKSIIWDFLYVINLRFKKRKQQQNQQTNPSIDRNARRGSVQNV